MNLEKPLTESLKNILKSYTNEINKALTKILNQQTNKLLVDIIEEDKILPSEIKSEALIGTELDEKTKTSLITAYDWAHFLFSKTEQKLLLKKYYDFFNNVTRPQFIKALESDNNIFYYIASVNQNQEDYDYNAENEDDDFDKNLIASCRLEIKSDTELHFASLFTSPAHHARLGLLAAKTIIDQASSSGFDVSANVDCNSPIVGYYLNNINFVANDILVDVENTGVNGWHLKRTSENKTSKRASENKVEISEIDFNNLPDDFELTCQTTNADPSFTSVCKNIFDQGFCLTNYEILIDNQRPEDEFQVMNSGQLIQRRFVLTRNVS